jgi:hypothetical protein
MASPASYQVLLLFTPTSTYDVTNDVEEISFDRSLATFNQPLQVGQGQIRLHNIYGRYTPNNTDSDLAMRPGLGVRVTGVSSGTTATRLFTGTIDGIAVDIALDSPRSSIWSLSDAAKPLADRRLLTPDHDGVCVSSLFSSGFASIGITTAQQSIATITDSRGWMTLGYENHGIDDMQELLTSGPFTVNIGRDGNVAVWNRYFHNSAAAVNTYTAMWALNYGFGDEVVFNRVEAKYYRRYNSGDVTNQQYGISGGADSARSIEIPASSWAVFEGGYYHTGWDEDRVWARSTTMSVFANNFDDQADGLGTGRDGTSSIACVFYGYSWVCTCWNGFSGTVYLWELALQGDEIGLAEIEESIVNNSVSQSLYGVRSIDFDLKTLTKRSAVRSMGSYICSVYGTAAVEFSATFRNEYPYALIEDVGSNISVVSSIAGINNKFTIMSSRTRITAGPDGWLHENEYDLREASKV